MSSSARSACCASRDWEFRQRGQSGLWISDLFPHLADVRRRADRHPLDGRRDLEPHAGDVSGEHRLSPATAFRRWGRGSPTAWAARPTTCRPSSSCPTRAACRPAARSTGRNGFLPARHQGVRHARHAGTPIDDLFPARPIAPEADRRPRRELARGDEPPAPRRRTAATTRWRPASAATSWPRRCSWPCRR